MPVTDSTSPSTAVNSFRSLPRMGIAQMIAFAVGLAICLPAEWSRLQAAASESTGPLGWLFHWNSDTTGPFMTLLLVPLLWRVRRTSRFGLLRIVNALCHWFEFPADHSRPKVSESADPTGIERNQHDRVSGQSPSPTSSLRERRTTFTWQGGLCLTLLASVVGGASFVMSVGVAGMAVGRDARERFGELPPAYHDEYAYLLQTRTFLTGQTSLPSHPTMPELFDQMHVLNEGQFASRYFPGTAFWMMPFVAAGHVWLGHWAAGAITAIMMFLSGREVAGTGVGFLAGLLTALSPAMGLFGNQLLAHHPTLVGLSIFLYCFLRLMRQPTVGWAVGAGTALTFAMLSRPMTAAGFALPFGIWLVFWLFADEAACGLESNPPGGVGDEQLPIGTSSWRARIPVMLGIGMPIVIGFVGLGAYNATITGSPRISPYQQFTDTYTPRHVYGFNNVVRGERRLGPKVLENYDRWAENLTPRLAIRNVGNRLIASLQWTFGLVPLAMALTLMLLLADRVSVAIRLLIASIVSLHVAHIPYWYDGIMHWHYVFETGPLLALMFAMASGLLLRDWRECHRAGMPVVWLLMVLASLATTFVSFESMWSPSRLRLAVSNVAFSRLKYAEFHRMLDLRVTERPALVLVQPDPDDRHIDYVTNDGRWSAELLIGRFRPGQTDVQRVVESFPDRTCYLYDVKTSRLSRLSPGDSHDD